MKKILVVDDETDVQFLFRQRFRKEIKRQEIEFIFAVSGEDALQQLEDQEEEEILILSDINMPGMSGLELLKHIKTTFDEPPPIVMMITAYGDAENHRTATSLGADGFLTKPLDFALLRDKIDQLD